MQRLPLMEQCDGTWEQFNGQVFQRKYPRFPCLVPGVQYFIMSDMELFIDSCNFYNSADNDFGSRSWSNVNVV